MTVLLLTCLRAYAAEASADRVHAAVAAALAAVTTGAVLVPGSLRFPQTSLRVDAAQFIVDKLTISRSGHLDATVQCAPINGCLPFAVSAEVVGQKSPAIWAARHSNKLGPELRSGVARARKEKSLKRGDRVLFVRERDGVRTRIQAVTLDNAAIGDNVRVRAVDGKHEIMRGRLCAEHIVREDS